MTPLILFTYQYKDHTSTKLSTGLGNNRLSYADANGNGKIDTPGSTAVTLWEETFEDKSKGNNDWDGSGNSWGWEITDIVSNKAKSGSKSGHISLDGLSDGWKNRACHSNEWIKINIDKPTLFRYSGWVFADNNLYRTRMYLFMKTNEEKGYNTAFSDNFESQKGKWVFMQKTVLVQPEIDVLNIRIDADGWGQRGGNAWFDDLKIEQLDMSQNEIVSETNYYPFGLAHKGYNEHVNSTNLGEQFKFNGVELNSDMNLGLYDMDFRQYDPTIGRFTGIDALSEQATNFSPYRFGFNNPIFYTDPTGLWEEIAGGYSTTDKDEIQRLLGYLKNETSDISYKGITNFVKEDISFFEGSGGYNEGYHLSGLTVKGGEATPYSIHKTKNEIAYYTRATDYLYTKEDYEMRNIILSGGIDPIAMELLRREYSGWYQPITAKNWSSYIGYKDSAQMLSFVSFFQLMDGPSLKVKEGRATSRNNLAANSSSALGKRLGFSNGVIPNDVKNMTFSQFRQRFSGQYKGKFKGRGTYMTFMSMDFKMIKNAK